MSTGQSVQEHEIEGTNNFAELVWVCGGICLGSNLDVKRKN